MTIHKIDAVYAMIMALITGLVIGILLEAHFTDTNPLPSGCTVETVRSVRSDGVSNRGAVISEETLYLVNCE